ncbi:MAG: A/G-specific adenine glycosylase [Gammaproteobacteria bacterium]|nr:A/G-specific adenine glycosylase [Gammaproteobacteria bacterium]
MTESHPLDHADVAPALLDWWHAHGRKDLPWQQQPNPYRVWVSEIMLQQTQVVTVERYYDRFMNAFPDLLSLASAELDRVLHLWSGLGYYARARNMHRAAIEVREHFNGELPASLDELMSLPGIGRSTAGAILALSSNQRHPILDGNAKRVLARLFAVEGWPGQSRVARQLWEYAERCTPTQRVAHYTQAIMDLGASLCARSSPACERCPFEATCAARRAGRIAEIPGKPPRKKRPQRNVTAILVTRPDGAVLLEQRPAAGIWGGLWGFPETDDPKRVSDWCEAQLGLRPVRLERRPVLRHAFTHFDLDIKPVLATVDGDAPRVMEAGSWLWYKLDEPAEVGLAAPVARLLQDIGE